jgi:hypothetical protein
MLYDRCAGLDVHKKSVSACIRISKGKETSQETRTFGTTRNAQVPFYATIGLARSSDNGVTWTRQGAIVSGTDPKPDANPARLQTAQVFVLILRASWPQFRQELQDGVHRHACHAAGGAQRITLHQSRNHRNALGRVQLIHKESMRERSRILCG